MSQKKTILVTGGAGYIGRCTAYVLAQNGYQPVLIDNFSTGRRENLAVRGDQAWNRGLPDGEPITPADLLD